MKRLLGVFVVAALYLVAVYHLTNLYFARQTAFEAFILLGRDGGIFPLLFWGGYVLLGTVAAAAAAVPSAAGRAARHAGGRAAGGARRLCLLYVFIIGGQAFPLDIFPGYEVPAAASATARSRTTRRAGPNCCSASAASAPAFVLTTVGVRVLDFMPQDDFAAPKPAPRQLT